MNRLLNMDLRFPRQVEKQPWSEVIAASQVSRRPERFSPESTVEKFSNPQMCGIDFRANVSAEQQCGDCSQVGAYSHPAPIGRPIPGPALVDNDFSTIHAECAVVTRLRRFRVPSRSRDHYLVQLPSHLRPRLPCWPNPPSGGGRPPRTE